MKKLGKLSINQSKLLKNEELVNLRGGYGFYNNELACRDWYGVLTGPIIIASGCNGDPDNDLGICNEAYATRAYTATCVL